MSRTKIVARYPWAYVMRDVYVDIMAENLNPVTTLKTYENQTRAIKTQPAENLKVALPTRVITMNSSIKLGLSRVPLISRLERNVWSRMMNHRERTHL